MINVAEAQALIKAQAFTPKTELLRLENAVGRVLAAPVCADRDYPPFNRSAMDGYAIRASEYNAGKLFKIAASVFAGSFSETAFAEGEVVKIMTGAPVPAAFDTVIRVEDAVQEEEGVRFTPEGIKAGQSIAWRGEDLQKGAEALPAGITIGPAEVTLLASLGKAEVLVYKSPKVVIIATGNEIKPLAEEILPHQIRDSNSFTLAAFFKQMKVELVERHLVEDDPTLLRNTIEQGMEADLIILSGGVSMGDADYVPETLQNLGVVKIFHKVKVKPGKPLWFGKKQNGPIVFGIPGNPFSCQIGFLLFIQPLLRESFGQKVLGPLYFKTNFERNKKGEMEEYFPCMLAEKEGEVMLLAKSFNGSGDITATAMSDGLACQPSEVSHINKGDLLAFYPWR